MICYKCEKEIQLENNRSITRKEECTHCGVYLRCCLMCSFHDKSSYNECKEPMSERITEKEKPNFCDYFELNESLDSQSSKKEDALADAMALFKK